MEGQKPGKKVVLALIENEGKFVLIRRKLPSFKVEWAFPGGVTKEGESEEEAVVREAGEEVCLDVDVLKKLLERKHPNTLVPIAYFHCKPKDSSAQPKIGEDYEISEVGWVPAKEVLERFTSDVHEDIEKFVKSFS